MPNDVINTITIGNTTYDIVGSGSGHTIEKSDGTDMTQRANLQFVDANITDDSTNDRTKIENVKTITNESELDDLPDGIYIGPTDEGLPFDAGDIPYDNTESSLSSDNIQDAIDELDDVITTNESTIEGNPINFSTLSAQNAASTIIDLEPIQDLHGFDKPWVGGAGKNLLGFTEADIMSLNSGVTITNHQATIYGAGFTFETDSNGYINKVIFDGTTPTNDVTLKIHNLTDYIGQTIIINGSPSDGSTNVYFQAYAYDGVNVTGSYNGNDSVAFSPSNLVSGSCLRLVVKASATYSKSYSFYPMVRLSTVSNKTFEPYKNICPISGRTEIGILGRGVNIWDEEWEVGGLNAETGEETAATNRIRSKNYIPIAANSSYYCAVPFNSNDIRLCYYDKNKTFVSSSKWMYKGIFTTPQNVSYIRFYVGTVYGTTYNNDISINSDSTDTSYHAYDESNNLTISLGQTVYGGSLDVENGVLVVTDKMITLNSLEWVRASSIQKFVSEGDISDAPRPSDSGAKIVSSAYKNIYTGSPVYITDITNGCIGFAMKNLTSARTAIVINDTRFDNATDFINEVGNETVVYPLATPITIQLTPNEISLLEGVNNIFTTGDKITLTYRDGKVATLKDIKDSLESSKPVYSTVETVIGTYLNKPLYSKTYQIQFSSSNSYYFDVPSTMDIKFVLGGVYSTRYDFIPFGYGGSGGDMVQCYRFSDTQFRVQNDYYASRMYCDITLQYTKSTD